MFDIEVPSLSQYSSAYLRNFIAELNASQRLSNLEDWSKRANEEVEKIRTTIANIESKLSKLKQEIEQAKREFESKSFLSKAFSSRQEERKLIDEYNGLAKEKEQLGKLIDELKSTVEFLPRSQSDLKELIRGCQLRKKELTAEKKAVNEQIREIRVQARQKTANTSSGKVGTDQRKNIRYWKENQLSPYENKKANLEQQIIKLDKTILWLERFK